MFNKKKKQQTPEIKSEEQKFQKDIKLLWIYTTLFCLFALSLIVVSSLIQGKMNANAEYYQGLYEGEKTSKQSAIKNIQDSYQSALKDNERLREENEKFKEEANTTDQVTNMAASVIENSEYLLKAQKLFYEKQKDEAAKNLKLVDSSMLTEEMKTIYDSLAEQLN